jgi:V8-like Glu-specific endopeptidase
LKRLIFLRHYSTESETLRNVATISTFQEERLMNFRQGIQTCILPALALTCFGSATAFAQSDAKATAILASHGTQLSEDAHTASLQEFWTADRLAAARPLPLPKVDPTTVAPSNAPVAPGPMHFGAPGLPDAQATEAEESLERFPLSQGADDAQADTTASPDAFNYEMPFNNFRTGINSEYPYSTMGKLFFTIPSGTSEPAGEYVCSAAVVGNQHLVITARHCMFDYVTSKWYSNWIFYPEWKNGKSKSVGGKSGAWYPEWLITWTSSSTLSLTTGWDIGMMIMHDGTGTGCGGDKGKQLGHYTGYLGWVYGGSNAQSQWNQFGYPQAPPFEGNYLYQNNGATGAVDPLGTSNIVEVGDPQTGGSSGGPWVIGFNPGNGKNVSPNNNFFNGNNFANGVNSFVWTSPSEPLAINGTIFQQANFDALYNDALALTCK